MKAERIRDDREKGKMTVDNQRGDAEAPALTLPAAHQRRALSLSGVGLTLLAVLSVSTSALFVRLAGQVSAYEIAFWRLVIASTVLTPPMLLRGEWHAVRTEGLRRFAVYGLTLAVHFIGYNLGLRYAPVAHVMPLVYTSTIFLALLSAVILHEPLRRLQIVGVVVVIVGIGVLAGFEPHLTPRLLLGDAWAIVSAIAFAFYSLLGRQTRERVPLLGYAVGVYALAALWTAPFALAAALRAPLPLGALGRYTPQVMLALLGLGLLPNAIGHTLYNASVRRVHPAVANVLFTQEVTGAIVLAWLFLGEVPSPNALVGALIMLAGIIMVLLG